MDIKWFLNTFLLITCFQINYCRKIQHGFLYPPKIDKFNTNLPLDQWFTQKLDHSDPTTNSTWQQLYYSDDTYYQPGGPVFLMIGGEGPASPIWMTTGSWISYAKEMNAYLFQLEHRFYGKSHPTKDVSVESLKYLTTENALMDLATFIVAMQEKHNLSDAKWVSFGGSYPGTLSAWLRMKYPHLIHAAVSSSAPVIAQVNFDEYLEVVDSALKTSSSSCNDAIKAATRQLDLYTMHRVGWNIITDEFKLCKPFNGINKLDVANLHSVLAGNFEDVVQYNKDNRAFEGAVGTNITIDTLCDIMTNSSIKHELTRYAAVNNLILKTYNNKCLNHTYIDMIHDLQSTEWNNEGVGGRAWTYQTCTEYGFYQGSDSKNQPFGNYFPTKFFVNQCRDIFGSKFDEDLLERGVRRTNTIYGAKNLKVKRVVFLNGSIDPWHALGITKDLNEDAPAIFINGTAHCANMYPIRDDDLPELNTARERVLNLLKKWLKED